MTKITELDNVKRVEITEYESDVPKELNIWFEEESDVRHNHISIGFEDMDESSIEKLEELLEALK